MFFFLEVSIFFPVTEIHTDIQVTLWDGEKAGKPAKKDLERNLLST